MQYEIVHLEKAQWKGAVIPMRYTTQEYYDVAVSPTLQGFVIHIEKKQFETPVTHTPEEYDYPDRLYEDYRPNASAWGVVLAGELVAAIEWEPEIWSNRLRVNELWVSERFQKQGLGHALMERAKEQAALENRRAIILETQSCNVNAIGFYLHEGFQIIGLDTCSYSNRDLDRKEVRIEMGYLRT